MNTHQTSNSLVALIAIFLLSILGPILCHKTKNILKVSLSSTCHESGGQNRGHYTVRNNDVLAYIRLEESSFYTRGQISSRVLNLAPSLRKTRCLLLRVFIAKLRVTICFGSFLRVHSLYKQLDFQDSRELRALRNERFTAFSNSGYNCYKS